MCSESMMPSSSGSGVAALIQRAKSVRVDGAWQPARSKAMADLQLDCETWCVCLCVRPWPAGVRVRVRVCVIWGVRLCDYMRGQRKCVCLRRRPTCICVCVIVCQLVCVCVCVWIFCTSVSVRQLYVSTLAFYTKGPKNIAPLICNREVK